MTKPKPGNTLDKEIKRNRILVSLLKQNGYNEDLRFSLTMSNIRIRALVKRH